MSLAGQVLFANHCHLEVGLAKDDLLVHAWQKVYVNYVVFFVWGVKHHRYIILVSILGHTEANADVAVNLGVYHHRELQKSICCDLLKIIRKNKIWLPFLCCQFRDKTGGEIASDFLASRLIFGIVSVPNSELTIAGKTS